MNKFEKIKAQTFRNWLNLNRGSIESQSSIEEKVDWMINKMPLPVRATKGSAGYDLIAPYDIVIPPHGEAVIPTGLKIKLEEDKFLAIYIRSSFAIKKRIRLSNQVTIIDQDYYNNPNNEGHILEILVNDSSEKHVIRRGERFAQAVIQQFFKVEGDKAEAKRIGGFGSTDTQHDEPLTNEEKERIAANNRAMRNSGAIMANKATIKNTATLPGSIVTSGMPVSTKQDLFGSAINAERSDRI